jgi:DNA-binding response OmpR family regulator
MTSVLVVEDDVVLAYALAGNLRDVGYRVVGPAPNLATANRLLADNKIDVACLDVRLGEGETSVPLAHSLAALGIPFMFLTAYPVAYLPIDMRDRPKLDKPFEPQVLVDRLAQLVEPAAARQRPEP